MIPFLLSQCKRSVDIQKKLANVVISLSNGFLTWTMVDAVAFGTVVVKAMTIVSTLKKSANKYAWLQKEWVSLLK